MSRDPRCARLAGSKIVNMLTMSLHKKISSETSLTLATLCNISTYPEFYPDFNESCVANIVKFLSPIEAAAAGVKIAMSTVAAVTIVEPNMLELRLEALNVLYNLLTHSPNTRKHAITNGLVSALRHLLKEKGALDAVFPLLASLVRHMCGEAVVEKLQRKLLFDGVLKVLHELSQADTPGISLCVTVSLCYLGLGPDLASLLKTNYIDLLYNQAQSAVQGKGRGANEVVTIFNHCGVSLFQVSNESMVAGLLLNNAKFVPLLNLIATSKDEVLITLATYDYTHHI